MPVAIFAIVAAPWLFLVAYAESHCPVIRNTILGTSSRCGKGDGPLWFLAMVSSPIGGFATLGLLVMALSRVFRR
jgi:hypothetical protein